jgi:SagB-type dehydrogenase family enzyme
MRTRVVSAILLICPAVCLAADLKVVSLPAPQTGGGKPLMQVLKERHSSRAFDAVALPSAVLSNLLWAAAGVNRPDGRRTAPSAVNYQETDIYVATADGVYRYGAKEHQLVPVLGEDIRALTGQQDFVKTAPLNLVYVVDFARMGKTPDDTKVAWSAADVGFIAENVYLYCTSEGLATVVRAMIDRPALSKALKLRPEQRIVLAQTVGYPRK